MSGPRREVETCELPRGARPRAAQILAIRARDRDRLERHAVDRPRDVVSALEIRARVAAVRREIRPMTKLEDRPRAGRRLELRGDEPMGRIEPEGAMKARRPGSRAAERMGRSRGGSPELPEICVVALDDVPFVAVLEIVNEREPEDADVHGIVIVDVDDIELDRARGRSHEPYFDDPRVRLDDDLARAASLDELPTLGDVRESAGCARAKREANGVGEPLSRVVIDHDEPDRRGLSPDRRGRRLDVHDKAGPRFRSNAPAER